ncbi:MAG: hypothetical protein AAF804_01780, partial [Bacteroidota bacterium]
RSSTRDFHIEELRSFVKDGKAIAEVLLVPKEEQPEGRGTFLVDLETYGLLKARLEGLKNAEYHAWTELAFVEQEGKFYITYIDRRYFSDAYESKPHFHHILATLTVVNKSPSEDAIGYVKLCFKPVDDYEIAWDDPSWANSSMLPWPNWIAKKLVTRQFTR